MKQKIEKVFNILFPLVACFLFVYWCFLRRYVTFFLNKFQILITLQGFEIGRHQQK